MPMAERMGNPTLRNGCHGDEGEAPKAFRGGRVQALIRRLPLRPIKDDNGHEQATAVVQELIGRSLDAGASHYLDTLILLVDAGLFL
jgi:hypothetical protein